MASVIYVLPLSLDPGDSSEQEAIWNKGKYIVLGLQLATSLLCHQTMHGGQTGLQLADL